MAVDREKTLQAAQKHVDKRRYDKAIEEYRRLVASDPSDVRTLLRIGDLHLKLKQFDEAVSTYEQVGDHYYREGFSVKAIAVYKQIRGIIRRHAEHLEGRYGHIVPRLAEIYTSLGLTSDALAAYDEVATRFRREGRERDALDIFKKVVDLDPQNPIAHLRVADSRARLGDMDKAVARFGQAADIMVQLGRVGDALKVLDRLLEFREAPQWARRAAELYLDRGEANDGMAALKKLQLAFKKDPKDLLTLKMLARAFDSVEQPKKATEVLKESARIAKDAGNRAAFDELLEILMERAPDDTLVGKLAQWQGADEGRSRAADVEVEVSEADIDLDEADLVEMEEVLEIDEDELVEEDPREAAVQRLLSESEDLRNAGALDNAIRVLRDGLRELGSSPVVRQRLSDLLLEAGDQIGSITEKLIVAREVSKEGHIEAAIQMVDEVLLLQPGQPDALRMRASLGYPIDEDVAQQTYDVESGGVEEALVRSRHHSAPAIPVVLDDPFGDAPPMATRISQPPSSGASQPPMASEPPPRISQMPLDEAALDQAEVLADQGRFEEARAILNEQLAAMPDHPLILDRLADLEVLAAHASTSYSGTFPGQPSEAPSFESVPPSQAPSSQSRSSQYNWNEVDSLLDQVREGVRNQVAEGDAATHYDLGIAYKEMGLHNDAINELSLAARDPNRECVCLSMVGTIHLQLGDLESALDALHKALNAEVKTGDQELAIGYEIANTYEMKSMPEQALTYFEWLAKVDPQYDDPRGSVAERIHALRSESGAQPRPQRPAATPDAGDLGDAFDDMFEEG